MDKTTNELRARLRARYTHHRMAIGDPEPESGYFKWLHSRLREELPEGSKGAPALVGDSMTGRGGKADQMALVILRAIAGDEELGFLCQSLGLRRALACVPGDAHYTRDEWAIAWPDGTTFPHDLRDARTTLTLVLPVLDAWIDHLAEEADIQSEVGSAGLSTYARAVLKLLFKAKAFDEKRACNLTKRAPTDLESTSAKRPSTRINYAKRGAAELRRCGLAIGHPKVGTYLTPKGQNEAKRLFGAPGTQ